MKEKQILLFILPFLMFSYLSCSKDSPTKPEPELTFEEKLQKALDSNKQMKNNYR